MWDIFQLGCRINGRKSFLRHSEPFSWRFRSVHLLTAFAVFACSVRERKCILLPATNAAPPSLPQRAKIGKNSEGKSGNATSRFDSNGNQDRMKLADFNFLMVLGKGSFGKVRPATATPYFPTHC